MLNLNAPEQMAARGGSIGWAIDEHTRTDLFESALAMAVSTRGEPAETVMVHADYAEAGVKPRNRGMACSARFAEEFLGLTFRALSETVEGLEFAFGERFDGQGVDRGGGRFDGLSHHVQGRECVESCCGGGVFVAEESHDDRQWDPLLVKVHGFGLSQHVAVDVLGDRGALVARGRGGLLERGRDRVG